MATARFKRMKTKMGVMSDEPGSLMKARGMGSPFARQPEGSKPLSMTPRGNVTVTKKTTASFKPTQPLGAANPAMMKKLQKEAPETLKAPTRKSFANDASYNEAVRKFKKFGNWASNK